MARAIWSGTVGFGLVSIPVRMHSAVRDRSLRFHRLSPDGHCRLRTKLYCPDTGEEVSFKDAARGYEVAPDSYVLVGDDELESVRPAASRLIEIVDFVDLAQIDPIYFDRPYHLTPDRGGQKPYRLLGEAMARSERVAIARFVMRSQEHLAVLRAMHDVLLLSTMHYRDEVVLPEDLDEAPEQVELKPRELAMAEQLIDTMRVDFDPSVYRNEMRDQLEALLRAKAEGQVVVAPSGPAAEPGQVVDLMDALKRSLGQAKRGEGAEREAGRETERGGETGKRAASAQGPGPKKAGAATKAATGKKPSKRSASGKR